ncbi:hypothetical protein IKD49_03045 [Candidatus Saccharibacteria bacterium]|nr:hypothetical protein [Candidatus Saccharibacteria bacterium]
MTESNVPREGFSIRSLGDYPIIVCEKVPVVSELTGSYARAQGGCPELGIFFWPRRFDVDRSKMLNVLNSLVFYDECTAFDISRLPRGDIRIFFNPIYHNEHNKNHAIEKVVEVLEGSRIDLTEDLPEEY